MTVAKPRHGSGPGRKPRKRLPPSEKYELFVQVLTQQATQREAAEKFGVDRYTVVHVCKTAKQGALDALAASVPGHVEGASAGWAPGAICHRLSAHWRRSQCP